jgi:hypothetical protein
MFRRLKPYNIIRGVSNIHTFSKLTHSIPSQVQQLEEIIINQKRIENRFTAHVNDIGYTLIITTALSVTNMYILLIKSII